MSFNLFWTERCWAALCYKEVFVDERFYAGCEELALLTKAPRPPDTSGKVFNVSMAMTCRQVGCWVRGGWEGSKRTREAKV